MYETVAILALAVLGYSLVATRLAKTRIAGAITFTAIGLFLGKDGIGLLHLTEDEAGIGVLAEVTLALLLFVDAANADLRELTLNQILPRRMLLIGLPLTIILGFAAGLGLVEGLALIEIALLATILAPTDAALGKAVITDETVPNRLRTTLNAESGLNDGICVPIFLTFLAFATATAGDMGFGALAFKLILEQIGIGAAVGIGFAAAGALGVVAASRSGLLDEIWSLAAVPALAIACFAGAQALGGSGFIACFVGGLVFGGLARQDKHSLLLAAESSGEVFAMLTWIVFGATVAGGVFATMNAEMLIYAGLSLTVVRMLPIWISLRGVGLNTWESLFLGWFGPRGMASIVFAIMVVDAHLPGGDIITSYVGCTILLSVIAHGLTAKPAARFISSRAKNI